MHYGGKVQAQSVMSQSSYYSASDLRLHFGLGASKVADIDIYWPNGAQEHFKAVAADQLVTIAEGKGIVSRQELAGALPKHLPAR